MQTNRQQRNMNRAGNILARMLALLTAWTSLTTLAADLYVSPEGDGSAGTSWSTAYTNVQDALDAAVSNAWDNEPHPRRPARQPGRLWQHPGGFHGGYADGDAVHSQVKG